MRGEILQLHRGSGPGSLYVLVPLCLTSGLLERLWTRTQAFPGVGGGTVPTAILLIQTGALLRVSASCPSEFFVCREHGCLLKEMLRVIGSMVRTKQSLKEFKNNLFFFPCDCRAEQLRDGLWGQSPSVRSPAPHGS